MRICLKKCGRWPLRGKKFLGREGGVVLCSVVNLAFDRKEWVTTGGKNQR